MHNEAKKISECIKEKINEIGIDNIDEKTLCELGQWTDIVKDMVEYDYYKRIVDAMDEVEESEELERKMYGDRMGYRGRDSKGRFVHRSGRGRSAGYTPFIPPFMMGEAYEDEYDYPEMYENYRMGYPMDGVKHKEWKDGKAHSRHGETYDKWDENRRYYTETKDAMSKQKMDESTQEYVDEFAENLREMYRTAEAPVKQKLKADLTKMVQQLQ